MCFLKHIKIKIQQRVLKLSINAVLTFFIGLFHFDVLENFICRRNNYIYFVASILFDFNAITWLMSHHL